MKREYGGDSAPAVSARPTTGAVVQSEFATLAPCPQARSHREESPDLRNFPQFNWRHAANRARAGIVAVDPHPERRGWGVAFTLLPEHWVFVRDYIGGAVGVAQNPTPSEFAAACAVPLSPYDARVTRWPADGQHPQGGYAWRAGGVLLIDERGMQ